jgi:hypothetical protein
LRRRAVTTLHLGGALRGLWGNLNEASFVIRVEDGA